MKHKQQAGVYIDRLAKKTLQKPASIQLCQLYNSSFC